MDTTRATDTTVIGAFDGYAEARRALQELHRAGFADDRLGIIGPDWQPSLRPGEHHTGLPNDSTHTHWEEGTGIGAAAGGATGLGLGIAVVTGLLPPLGPVLAGGTFVALLASAGTGAAVGTVVGGLIGLGLPEDDARWGEAELSRGRYLVAVRGAERGDEARDVIRRCGGEVREPADIGIYGTGLVATPY